jgi:hypothetical protein
MAVDNEKYRATGVVHRSLAEVDESGGFELTRVGGETQSSLRAQCRDGEVESNLKYSRQ